MSVSEVPHLQGLPPEGSGQGIEHLEDRPPDFPKETTVEMRCFDAFSAVSHFERTHCLALQVPASPLHVLATPVPPSTITRNAFEHTHNRERRGRFQQGPLQDIVRTRSCA